MFSDCSSLTSVTIPEGVTIIGESVFAFCSNLKSITIPESATSIGKNVFGNCKSFTSIKGKAGSYAETWAKENYYTFIAE